MTRGDLPHWYQPGCAHFVTYRVADTIPATLLRKWRIERDDAYRRGPSAGESDAEHRATLHRHFFEEYDSYLDRANSSQWLADDRVSAIVRENLYHHRGSKYELLAYCIMPNHVHVLLQPFEVGSQMQLRRRALGNDLGVSPLARSAADAGLRRVQSSRSVGHGNGIDNDHSIAISEEISDRRSPLSDIMHSLKSYTANEANRILGREGRFWQSESYDDWVRDIEELERIVQYISLNPVRAGLCKRAVDWNHSFAADRYRLDGSECALIGWLRDDWRR